MRIKISFVRDQTSANTIPLHHQKLLAYALKDVLKDIPDAKSPVSFSSLKGTTKIQNGFMRVLSTKVTLVISSPDKDLAESIVKKIFDRGSMLVGKMKLLPRAYDVIPDPEFQTRMRYLCISPLILVDPKTDPEKSKEQIDPTSQQFSDLLYNHVIDMMEKSGYNEDKLNEFVEFEAIPDKDYVNKINETGKKYARFYKNMNGDTMLGYLLPFTLHAHPEVHNYIWTNGLGVLNDEGYGMIDRVK